MQHGPLTPLGRQLRSVLANLSHTTTRSFHTTSASPKWSPTDDVLIEEVCIQDDLKGRFVDELYPKFSRSSFCLRENFAVSEKLIFLLFLTVL